VHLIRGGIQGRTPVTRDSKVHGHPPGKINQSITRDFIFGRHSWLKLCHLWDRNAAAFRTLNLGIRKVTEMVSQAPLPFFHFNFRMIL
jgi:hypothetical protein